MGVDVHEKSRWQGKPDLNPNRAQRCASAERYVSARITAWRKRQAAEATFKRRYLGG